MQVHHISLQRACRRLRTWFALMLLCMLSLPVMANDGFFYATGNQLVPWFNKDVRVQKEILTIRLLNGEEAQVDVYYEFYNQEDSDTLTVGFEALPPEMFDLDMDLTTLKGHPYMHDFSVEVNGLQLPHEFATVVNDSSVQTGRGLKILDLSRYVMDEAATASNLYVKDHYEGSVPITFVYYFKALFNHGLNRVHHRYTYRMNESIVARYFLNYKLSPALRWANHQIDDFTLRIEAPEQGLHFFLDANALQQAGAPVVTPQAGGAGKYQERQIHTCYPERDTKAWEFSLRNAVAEFHEVNYRPADELYLVAADFSKSGNCNEPDVFGQFYENFGKTRTAIETRAFQHLKQAEAGERFKDKKLQKYFDAWWWYMPKNK